MSANIIDNVASIRKLVEFLENMTSKPLIFVDLEGVNLSRHGSVAIMQLLVPPDPEVHLIDIHALRNDAFTTCGPQGQTLKKFLESDDCPKIFFDVRNDSDALFSHFQIELCCVIDLQLVEFASRPQQGRLLNGLAKCVSEEAYRSNISSSSEWMRVKEAGQRLFHPKQGGKFEVFLERPLPTALIDYCKQDASMLPQLLLVYSKKLRPHMARQVHLETLERIKLSQSPNFDGKGRHMALGPSLTWKKPRYLPQPDLPFPIEILCSGELEKLCSLDESLRGDFLNENGKPEPNHTVATGSVISTADPLDLSSERIIDS